MVSSGKKRAIDVVIESFLKRVDEEGVMPWQNPHKFGVSINWVSKKMYRGINRILLPYGEYMTKNQLNKYNEEHNEDFKFQKGIVWYPVVFYSKKQSKIKPEDVSKELNGVVLDVGQSIKSVNGYTIIRLESGYFKEYMILRYSLVAEISHFKNSKGETLPRRIGSDGSTDLTLSFEEPQRVIDSYLTSSGVGFEEINDSRSYYNPSSDTVHINESYKWNDAKYSVAFHELAHSTGHAYRLNRDGIVNPTGFGTESYAVEECIAEITASLLCHETGVSTFVTSGTLRSDNSAEYVKSWKKSIKDWGNKFVGICKQAELAYFYILGEDSDTQDSGSSSREV